MRTEKVLFLLFIIALGLRFLHIPLSAVSVVMSLSVLAMLYFPLGFYFLSVNSLKEQNVLVSIATGFFLSGGVIGILFKIMYWPGSGIMLAMPLPFLLLFFLLPFISRENNLKEYYRRIKIRTGVIGLLAMTLYFIPDKTLLELQHWDDPELARLKHQSYSNPDSEEFRLQLKEYQKSREDK